MKNRKIRNNDKLLDCTECIEFRKGRKINFCQYNSSKFKYKINFEIIERFHLSIFLIIYQLKMINWIHKLWLWRVTKIWSISASCMRWIISNAFTYEHRCTWFIASVFCHRDNTINVGQNTILYSLKKSINL